jgi:hypothetical protein
MSDIRQLVREALDGVRMKRSGSFIENVATSELLERGAEAVTAIEAGVLSCAAEGGQPSGLGNVLVVYSKLVRELELGDQSVAFLRQLQPAFRMEALCSLNIVWRLSPPFSGVSPASLRGWVRNVQATGSDRERELAGKLLDVTSNPHAEAYPPAANPAVASWLDIMRPPGWIVALKRSDGRTAKAVSMTKLVRSPLMVIPAMAGAAFLGWWVWPAVVSILISVLSGIYRGNPLILYWFLARVGAVLSASTAFAFILSRGPGRRIAGGVLIVATTAALIWSGPLAWDFTRSDGRRLAFTVYGLPMIWACLLGVWGYRMLRHHRRRDTV